MGIYQKSVLNKYLKTLPEKKVKEAYSKFKSSFQTEERIKVIRSMKEEEYQAGFLKDLLVDILGYTLKPDSGHNLELEKKNTSNAKKADGAILVDDEVVGVIELKSTSTVDIRKIEYQAFGYKSTHPKCKYVITSNFAVVRIYINDTTSFEDFYLFDLSEERFNILYLLLHWHNLASGLPDKIKNESVLKEEDITKKFYKDYSNFKIQLFNSIKSRNNQYNELQLFKKTQKLLDRLLFIFFAEDKGLLPPNSISRMIDRFNLLNEEDSYKPLYSIFKQYFGYFNKGRKGKKPADDIFAYNGGLFYPDEILDKIELSDKVLLENCLLLSKYDFATEVDVNILGHIFEHSLNEIEEISTKIEGKKLEKNQTKRKKDGVFYTPKYITKHIVENSIGKLCEDKKEEIGIKIEEFVKDRKSRKKTKLKELEKQLSDYQNYLFSLRICDPAVGSGAFLNQAFNFLLEEHEFIAFLRKSLFGESIQFEVANDILEKNLYGVDINEESVDIAKLSLWLRTAKKGRTLSTLSNNLKCGNSLIDDDSIVGNKAFDWQKEFPEVFSKGGFDIILGNPPYVKRQELDSLAEVNFLESNYKSATYNFDLYLLFIERGSKLINESGILSFINPSKFTSTKVGEGLRAYLKNNCHILNYVDFKEFQVFKDATTYCCIISLKRGKFEKTKYILLNPESPKNLETYKSIHVDIKDSQSGLGWNMLPTIKIRGEKKLGEIVDTFTGIESGADSIYILESDSNELKTILEHKNDLVFPTIKGSNVYRYYYESTPYFSIIPYREKELINKEILKSTYTSIWSYLLGFENELRAREKGKMDHDNWYGFVYPKNLYKFNSTRLIWTDISIRPQFVVDENKNWHVRTVCSLELKKEKPTERIDLNYLLGVLNSNLLFYFIKTNSNSVRGGYYRYKPQYIKEFPIVLSLEEQSLKISQCAKNQLDLTSKANHLVETLLNLLRNKYNLNSLSKKLSNWENLDFKSFLAELKKKKVELNLKEEAEWMQYFNEQKEKIKELRLKIFKTDKEIDQMVYKLYGLSDEEIKIVEEATS